MLIAINRTNRVFYMEKYRIILEKNGQYDGRYKVNKELFEKIKAQIKPFRGFSSAAKPVRCVETGRVFKSAAHAQCWVYDRGLTTSMNFNAIKNVCKGIKETMYGYHWEYAET